MLFMFLFSANESKCRIEIKLLQLAKMIFIVEDLSTAIEQVFVIYLSQNCERLIILTLFYLDTTVTDEV